MTKRILCWLLIAAMMVGFFPAVQAANKESEITQSTYEQLGFKLNTPDATGSYLGPGNTVLKAQKELHLDYNGSVNYGWMVRDNMSLEKNWRGEEYSGAYKLYGQYNDGEDWDLSDDWGYNYGETGGLDSVLNYSNTSKKTHKNRVYTTSTAFRSESGKEDRVARIIVESAQKRADYKIKLELVAFTDDYSPSCKHTIELPSSSALDERGYWYNHSFDAIFDITAGDYNGDGIDEVAVYAANNEVRIYTTKGDKLTLWMTLGTGYPNSDAWDVNTDSGGRTRRVTVVSLASGDLKKDFTEELVVATSMPNIDINKQSDAQMESLYKSLQSAGVYIYSFEDDTANLEKKIGVETESRYIYQLQRYTISGSDSLSVVIGDLSGDGKQELIIAGQDVSWIREDDGESDSWVGRYDIFTQYVEFDYTAGDEGEYVVGEKQLFNASSISARRDGESLFESDHSTVSASSLSSPRYQPPIALGIADMNGLSNSAQYKGNYILVYERLFQLEVDQETGVKTLKEAGGDSGRLNFMVTELADNANDRVDKKDIWISDVLTGNFTGNEEGREQILAVVGVRQEDDYQYWYQLAWLSMDEYGNFYASCEGILNQANTYLNQSSKSRASAYVDISAPDVDKDSVVLEFQGVETAYSKPEPQAILQSAPYFQDVEDAYGYLSNGATALGKTSGSGHGVTASVEASLGAYTSVDASFFAAGEFELEVKATTSYEHSSTWETSTSVEYSASVGDDYVIVYTIPYYNYYYKAWYMDQEEPELLVIQEPLGPAIMPITVDAYDKVANQTLGMDPIRGNLLESTPGDPYSYVSWPENAGKFNVIKEGNKEWQELAPVGATLTTVSQEQSTSHEEGFSVGVEQSMKMGGGAGFLGNDWTAGFTESIAGSAGYVYSHMSGVTYTGSVDNMPEEAAGYGCSWQFGISEAKLNGEDVVILGYKTKDIISKPGPAKELSIVDVTSNSMTLNWEASTTAAYYTLYVARGNNEAFPMDTIPSTAVNAQGMVEWVKTGLFPATDYSFYLIAVDPNGVTSIPTPTVSGTTLPDDADSAFRIVGQPQDVTTYVGGEAAFSVEVEAADDVQLYYRWQQYNSESRSWESVGGASNTLVVTATEELDGAKYRAQVITGGGVAMYTQSATLTVGKASSSVNLLVTDGTQNLDGQTVTATTTETIREEVTEIVNQPVTATVDGVTYTKMVFESAAGDLYFWASETGEYYNASKDETTLPADPTAVALGSSGTFRVENNLETATEFVVSDYMNHTALAQGLAITVTVFDEEGTQSTKDVTVTAYCSTNATGITMYVAEGAGDAVDEYYAYYNGAYYEASLVSSQGFLKAESTNIELQLLTVVNQDVEVKTIVESTKTSQGTPVTFQAKAYETGGVTQKPITDSSAKVQFTLFNRTTGTTILVEGKYENGLWTADYTFTEPGVYEIVASFGGNDRCQYSESQNVILYVVGATKTLSIQGGGMAYGDTLYLNPQLLDGQTQTQTQPEGVIYNVAKSGTTIDGLVDEDGLFAPDSVGEYRITATYEDGPMTYVAMATVTVYHRTLTIAAVDKAYPVNSKEADRMLEAEITGLAPGDSIPEGAYVLSSEGIKASATKGSYAINVALTSAGREALSDKYTVILQAGILTLTEKGYKVETEVVGEGQLTATYTPQGSAPLNLTNGMSVPEGSHVVFTAKAQEGYQVKSWLVETASGSSYVLDAGGYYTGNVHQIPSLAEATKVTVEFELKTSKLTFGGIYGGAAAGSQIGTVTGRYLNGGAFSSGSQVSYFQSVRLMANPAEGYTIGQWEVTQGGNTEIILADDGKSVFTGTELDFARLTEATDVRVVFVKAQEIPVTIKVVDNDRNILSSAVVRVNGQEVEKNDSGIFTYTGKNGENLTLTVETPDGVLVKSWTVGSGQTTGSVSDQNRTMTVYNLQAPVDFTVQCEALNQYTVHYATYVDGQAQTDDRLVRLTAVQVGNGYITSGTSLWQGATVQFTASSADAYQIDHWTINGKTVTATGDTGYQTYQIAQLGENVQVNVYLRSRPVVTDRSEIISAKVMFRGTEVETQQGDNYIDYGTDVTVTVDPGEGYVVTEICGQAVNAEKANGPQSLVVENVTDNITLSAMYTELPRVDIQETDHVTVEVYGIVNGQRTLLADDDWVDYGTKLEIIATPEDAYVVSNISGTAVNNNRANGSVTLTTKELTGVVPYSVIAEVLAKPVITMTQPEGATLTAVGTQMGKEVELVSGDYVDFHSNLTTTVTPQDNYVVTGINGQVVNGNLANGPFALTTRDVQQDQILYAVTEAKPIVTMAQVENATITASGIRNGIETLIASGDWVDFGTKVVVTVTPEAGYIVTSIQGQVVNPQKANGPMTATVWNVTQDTQLVATVEAKAGIALIQPENGVLTATGVVGGKTVTLKNGDIVDYGTAITVTVTPNPGFVVSAICDQAVNAARANGPVSYTLETVTGSVNLTGETLAKPIVIIAEGENVTVTATGTREGVDAALTTGDWVDFNANVVVTATPATGFIVSSINGTAVNAEKANGPVSLTLRNVTENTELTATVIAKPVVTLVQPANGTLTATGIIGGKEVTLTSGDVVDFGTTVTVTVTPNAGFVVNKINGQEVNTDRTNSAKTLTIENVTEPVSLTGELLAKPIVTISAVENGTLNVTGIRNGADATLVSGDWVDFNSTLTITAAPEAGYVVAAINDQAVNEAKVNGQKTVTLEAVTADQTVTATMLAKPIITIAQVDNATITATGTRNGVDAELTTGDWVDFGGNVSVTVAPAEGYIVNSINGQTVNEAQAGGPISTTLRNINTDTQLTATVIGKPVITLVQPANGTLTATGMVDGKEVALKSGDLVDYGTTVKLTLAPNAGFVVSTINGQTVNADRLNGEKSVTVENITGNQTFTGETLAKPIITIAEGENVTITATGTREGVDAALTTGDWVDFGANVVITATPATGFVVNSINGTAVNAEKANGPISLTLRNVVENTQLTATVEGKPVVTLVQPANGTLTATGMVDGKEVSLKSGDVVDFGTTVTVTVTPDAGYVVNLINGEAVNADRTNGAKALVLEKVTAPATLTGELLAKPIITITAVANGTLTVTGIRNGADATLTTGDWVDFHSALTIIATPEAGFVVDSINGQTVNQAKANGTQSVILEAIAADQRVSATTLAKPIITMAEVENATITATGTRDGLDTALVTGDWVDFNANVVVTVTPAAGYIVNSICGQAVNPQQVNGVQTLTLRNVSADTQLTATVEAKPGIALIQPENGVLTAMGIIGGKEVSLKDGDMVDFGTAITVTVTPNAGFVVSQICAQEVNPTKANGPQVLVIENVTQSMNLTGLMLAKPIITMAEVENAAITATGIRDGLDTELVSGDWVDFGSAITVTVTPADGYIVKTICGQAVNSQKANGPQTATVWNVMEDTTLTAVLTAKPVISIPELDKATLTATGIVDGREVVLQDGSFVDFGSKIVVTVTPDAGYIVSEICNQLVNEPKANGTFTLDILVVEENMSLTALILAKPIITIPAISNGKLTATGVQDDEVIQLTSGDYVDFHTDLTVTATPDENYVVIGVCGQAVNDTKANGPQTVTVEDLTADYTLTAQLLEKPQIIVVDTAHGTVTATTVGHVDFGYKEVIVISALPDFGYEVGTWSITGVENIDPMTVPTSDRETYVFTPAEGGVQADVLISVSFQAIPTYTVQYSVADRNTGTLVAKSDRKSMPEYAVDPVTSGQKIYRDSVLTFTATAAENHRMDFWMVNGEVVRNEDGTLYREYTLDLTVVDQDITVEVFFRQMPHIQVVYNQGGTVTFTGPEFVEFGSMDNIVFTAQPEPGYVVESWTVTGVEDPAIVPVENSDDQIFTYIPDAVTGIQGDITVTVTFAELPQDAAVTFSVLDTNGKDKGGLNGTLTASAERKAMECYNIPVLTSGTTLYEGSTVTFTATPDNEYRVYAWFVDGQVLKDEAGENVRDLTLTLPIGTSDLDVQVQFELDGEILTYHAVGNGSLTAQSEGVTVESGTTITREQDITFTATAQDGYTVSCWTVNGETLLDETGEIYTAATYTRSVNPEEGLEIVVYFVRCTYNVTWGTEAGGIVTAEVDGEQLPGQSAGIVGDTAVTFQAHTAPGYTFTGWIVNGEEKQTTNASLTITVLEDLEVLAVFEATLEECTLTYEAVGNGTVTATVDGETVSSGVTLEQGTTVTFKAQAQSGYMVEYWTVNGQKVTGSEELKVYTMDLMTTSHVQAHFCKTPTYLVSITVTGQGQGKIWATVNGGTAYELPRANGKAKLELPRHSHLVLTLEPSVTGNNAIWTSENGTINGYDLILDDVVADVTATAEFTTQRQITVKAMAGANGTLGQTFRSVSAEGDEPLTHIITADGVQVVSGRTLIFTATPDAGYMVAGWFLGEGESLQPVEGEYGNTLTLENVLENVTVTVLFEQTQFFTIPTSTTAYAVRDIVRTPQYDYQGRMDIVRKNGTVSFTVAPKGDYELKNVTVNEACGTVTVERQEDGTWTVLVEGVKGDILMTVDAVETYTVTFATTGGKGTVEAFADGKGIASGDRVAKGTEVVFEAAASLGFYIKSWNATPKAGIQSDNDTRYTITVDGETHVTVEFAVYNLSGDDHNCLAARFRDVDLNAWYHEALDFVLFHGIFNGMNETQFAPNGAMTRAMMVTVLYRMEGMPDVDGLKQPFQDVPASEYYADAIRWAYENGIVLGISDTLFDPNRPITREQMVAILFRFATYKGYDTTIRGDLTAFADHQKVEPYAREALSWAVGTGLIQGMPQGNTMIIQPRGTATRAQIAAVIMRFCLDLEN